MKKLLILNRIVLGLLLCIQASAQSPAVATENYSKEGLSFDYPKGWTLADKSNATAQEIILVLPGTSAVIQVVAFRELLQSAEQVRATQESVTIPHAMKLASKLSSPLSQLLDNADCLPIGKRLASGVRLTGLLDKQPISAYVYTIVLGQRFLTFTYIRADKDDARGAEGWKMLLDTLKVEPPANQTSEAAKLDEVNTGGVTGGVLNGRVSNKPPPHYPLLAKRSGAQGTVIVQVAVDESGNVITAKAISGHPLLRGASEDAAKNAKFTPTLLCGRPVKVTGVITYNFVLQ
jgi:TonB family protein